MQLQAVELLTTTKFAVLRAITLKELGLRVLSTSEGKQKAYKTMEYVQLWQAGYVCAVTDEYVERNCACPDEPARPTSSCTIDTSNTADTSNDTEQDTKVRRILKRLPIEYSIHGIANAEAYAIDLFWDLIVRYTHYNLPRSFYDDMVYIANQEAEHFLSWDTRLEELGCPFGTLPFYEGLWQSAHDTAGDLMARLAVINLTHEAKGLDSYSKTREKFAKARDEASVAVLDNNCNEEIGHVAAGVKWFTYLCAERGISPVDTFHALSKQYFRGKLREPFNRAAREQAGLTEEWYMPLT